MSEKTNLKRITLPLDLFLKKFDHRESEWVEKTISALAVSENLKKFPVYLSLVTRKIENTAVDWSKEDLSQLNALYPGFEKNSWTKQDIARISLSLAIPEDQNVAVLEAAFETAEMEELIILYRSLYFLPNAVAFTKRFEEGIRTNMANVMDALGAYNPFPASYLEEHAWNQLVLKTIFMERPLYKMYHLDRRKNEKLANMLQDFVCERWSAHRQVSPEIWRLVQGYLREDVAEVLRQKEKTEIEEKAIKELFQNQETQKDFWDQIGLELH